MKTGLLILYLLFAQSAQAKEPWVFVIAPDQQGEFSTAMPEAMIQWLVDLRTAYEADPATGKNIRMVTLNGDIANDLDWPPGPEAGGEQAFVRWTTAFAIARAAPADEEIAVIPMHGNHDMANSLTQFCTNADQTTCLATWRTYFGASYWASDDYFVACDDGTAGTRYGSDANCAFTISTGNGTDRALILTTEFQPGASLGYEGAPAEAMMDWHSAKLDEYKHMPAFVFTHANLDVGGNPPQAGCDKNSSTTWYIDHWGKHDNWVALYNGHDISGNSGYYHLHADAFNRDPDNYYWTCRADTTPVVDRGFTVHQAMFNYQKINVLNDGNKGDGYMVFVTVDEDEGTLHHEVCQPPAAGGHCRPSHSGDGNPLYSENYTLNINLRNRRPGTGSPGGGGF